MPSISRVIVGLSVLFTTAMTIVMLFSFRKERRIGSLALLISAALSLVMLPIFMLLSGARLNLLLGMPLFVLGLLIGFLRGLATKLYYKDGQVVGRNSMFFLLGWGGSLVLAQLLNTFGSALLASIGLLPMFLSTGTQVGMNSNILLRRLHMRPMPAVPSVSDHQVGEPERVETLSPPPFLPERERTAPEASLNSLGRYAEGHRRHLPER